MKQNHESIPLPVVWQFGMAIIRISYTVRRLRTV